MTKQTTVLCDINKQGVATITLNRPDKGNAFDNTLINDLLTTLKNLHEDAHVRVVVLQGAGKHFCAGADLHWMQAMANYTEEENIADAMQLATLMRTLHELNKPTIALVQGASYGGGIGLIACCDLALATEDATFCFSEVKLGLIPAVISPYIVAAIGERQARRYFLTAEAFNAKTAQILGLIHATGATLKINELRDHWITALLQNEPLALSSNKQLLTDIRYQIFSAELSITTAQTIAKLRVSPAAQARMDLFLRQK